MHTKQKYHIFHKSLLGVAGTIVLSIFLLSRAGKDKAEFIRVDGEITYLASTYHELPNRDLGKYRYLQLSSIGRIFELFIGKDVGDFKPEYERLNALKVGDQVTLYYDENSQTEADQVNRLVQFIDQGKKSYFRRGSTDRILGAFCLGMGVLIGVVLFVLKEKEVIE